MDAYRNLADLYLALVTPEDATAQDIDDPVMSAWLVEHLPAGATILDAGCGLGFHAVALHRGLPARGEGRMWNVYASDFSDSMLSAAQGNGASAGILADRYRQCSFAGLKDIAAWSAFFDAVLINYAIYTFPDGTQDYDAYFRDCLAGVSHVLKPGGHLLFNTRDWRQFAAGGNANHARENIHGGISYHGRYEWQFGSDGCHSATIALSNSNGQKQTLQLNFAERTPAELAALLDESGFALAGSDQHDSGPEIFYTLIARKVK